MGERGELGTELRRAACVLKACVSMFQVSAACTRAHAHTHTHPGLLLEGLGGGGLLSLQVVTFPPPSHPALVWGLQWVFSFLLWSETRGPWDVSRPAKDQPRDSERSRAAS